MVVHDNQITFACQKVCINMLMLITPSINKYNEGDNLRLYKYPTSP